MSIYLRTCSNRGNEQFSKTTRSFYTGQGLGFWPRRILHPENNLEGMSNVKLKAMMRDFQYIAVVRVFGVAPNFR